MANLKAEAMVVVEVITMDEVTAGLIIEAITTINTVSIMVMMMTTSLINIIIIIIINLFSYIYILLFFSLHTSSLYLILYIRW